MVKTVCDRCGKEIPKGWYVGFAVTGFKGKVTVDGLEKGNEYLNLDFCESCLKKIEDFIKSKDSGTDEGEQDCKREDQAEIRKEPDGQVEEAELEQRKKKRELLERIDYGKVKALYKAGWTQKKIGEEIGKSQNTVSNAIKKYDAMIEGGYRWDAERKIFTIDKGKREEDDE